MHDDTVYEEFERHDDEEAFSLFFDSNDSETNNIPDCDAHKLHKCLEPHAQHCHPEPGLSDFDVEESRSIQDDESIDAGLVESWLQWQQEITRQILVHWIIRLFTVLIFLGLGIGFILFLITRKIEFLVDPPTFTAMVGVLALLRKVFSYYFKYPKK